MQKFIPEVLKEINLNPELIKNYRGDAGLNYIFKHAFDPALKFELPDGVPPFKPDAAPIGMTPATFKMELKRLYVFCRKDLPAVRRESLYMQLIEAIHPTEAEVLNHVKDQKLTDLYKNITHKLVYETGFQVPPPPMEEEKKTKKINDQITDSVTTPKAGRGRPKKVQGVTAP